MSVAADNALDTLVSAIKQFTALSLHELSGLRMAALHEHGIEAMAVIDEVIFEKFGAYPR